jgi:cell division protein FtsB
MLNRAYKTYGNVIELEYATISSKKSKSSKPKIRWNGRRLICTLLIVYVAANFGYWHYKINKVNAQIESLELKKMALQLEKNQLEKQKELVQDEKYVEKLARENLDLVKPGEKLILLAEPGEVMPLEMDENTEIYD